MDENKLISQERKRLQAKIAIVKGYSLVDGMHDDGKTKYAVKVLRDPQDKHLRADSPNWDALDAYSHYPMPQWMWDWKGLKLLIQQFPSPTKPPALMWTGERWHFKAYPFIDDSKYYQAGSESEFVAVGKCWLDWQFDVKNGTENW